MPSDVLQHIINMIPIHLSNGVICTNWQMCALTKRRIVAAKELLMPPFDMAEAGSAFPVFHSPEWSELSALDCFDCNGLGGGISLDDTHIAILSRALYNGVLPALRALYLCENNVSDNGLILLARHFRPQCSLYLLEAFSVGTHITDRGISHFAGALNTGGIPNIASLNISNNRITDIGILVLSCALGKMKHLKELHCVDNMFGDNGLISLFKNVQGLEILNIPDAGPDALLFLSMSLRRGDMHRLSTLYITGFDNWKHDNIVRAWDMSRLSEVCIADFYNWKYDDFIRLCESRGIYLE